MDSIQKLQVQCNSVNIISSTLKASHYLILSMLVETGELAFTVLGLETKFFRFLEEEKHNHPIYYMPWFYFICYSIVVRGTVNTLHRTTTETRKWANYVSNSPDHKEGWGCAISLHTHTHTWWSYWFKGIIFRVVINPGPEEQVGSLLLRCS